MRWILHITIVVALTILTQIGGLAWCLALLAGRKWLSFPVAYAALWGLAFVTAPLFGRTALPCFGDILRAQSPMYCVMARHYVTPDLAEVTKGIAARTARAVPGTVTLYLDGGFPFLDHMPLLPHLSHDDGEKLDLAFAYTDASGEYLPGKTRSPIGYFAFETLDDPTCPTAWPTLRWDLRWLQGHWTDRPLDATRTRALVQATLDDPRVSKIFLEPPLADRLDLQDPRLRFQGCRAARHDDHIHFQL